MLRMTSTYTVASLRTMQFCDSRPMPIERAEDGGQHDAAMATPQRVLEPLDERVAEGAWCGSR